MNLVSVQNMFFEVSKYWSLPTFFKIYAYLQFFGLFLIIRSFRPSHIAATFELRTSFNSLASGWIECLSSE